jgi:L-ascorbate metabolism protein UlaG (beta-lactamase superfamily)
MKRSFRVLRKIFVIIIVLFLVLSLSTWLFMKKDSFGKLPEGERLKRVQASSHYKDGIFVNLTETPMQPEGINYWDMTKAALFDRDEHNAPDSALPVMKPDFSVQGTKPQVTWFGHSSVLIQAAGKNILTDPNFSRHASPVQFAGPAAFGGPDEFHINDLPPVDIVLISHDHYDHLDHETILQLKDRVSAFYVPLGVGAHLEHWGVDPAKIKEGDWWEENDFGAGIKIVFTPSRHFSGRGFSFNKTSWTSYVIMAGDHRFFFSGDSGYEEHFKQIGEKFGPFDLVMIETGQYNDYWPYIHMMPEQSVQAAADLKAKVLLPVHWAKFALAMHSWTEPVERTLEKAATLNMKVTTPMMGERIIIDSIYPVKQWWK